MAIDAGIRVRGDATRARGGFLQVAAPPLDYALAHFPHPA
jgi:hypothetical protein